MSSILAFNMADPTAARIISTVAVLVAIAVVVRQAFALGDFPPRGQRNLVMHAALIRFAFVIGAVIVALSSKRLMSAVDSYPNVAVPVLGLGAFYSIDGLRHRYVARRAVKTEIDDEEVESGVEQEVEESVTVIASFAPPTGPPAIPGENAAFRRGARDIPQGVSGAKSPPAGQNKGPSSPAETPNLPTKLISMPTLTDLSAVDRSAQLID